MTTESSVCGGQDVAFELVLLCMLAFCASRFDFCHKGQSFGEVVTLALLRIALPLTGPLEAVLFSPAEAKRGLVMCVSPTAK